MVRHALEIAAEYLEIAVSNTVVTIHLELIVFGGGVTETGAVLLNTVRATVRRRVHTMPPEDIRIESSQLRGKAGRLGTAWCHGTRGARRISATTGG
jgi:predicted NBD/HSP70 family sugar kinase